MLVAGPMSTPRQLLACNVASGSSFGTGRGQEPWLRLPTQLLPVGKEFRKQPPRRCQESVLPSNAFPPVVGDGVQAVEGAGELPPSCAKTRNFRNRP